MFEERYKCTGNRIRYYRKQMDMEQVDFAQEVGITPQYLSKIECGCAKPSLDLLFLIAKCLNVDIVELIKDTDNL